MRKRKVRRVRKEGKLWMRKEGQNDKEQTGRKGKRRQEEVEEGRRR